MKTILISGGTGLVGQLLAQTLKDEGYNIHLISRSKPSNPVFPTFIWNVDKGVADGNAFNGVDIVINLAGSGVADKLWTERRKKEITESRVKSNQLLAYCFKNYHRPALYISAGAIGFYGHRNDELLTEEHPSGDDFLSKSCTAWEKAVFETADPSTRLIIFRIGIVLSERGGALQKMLLPWKMGISTSFNPGNQWYSWIHEEDLVRLFVFGIQNDQIEVLYNAVAPNPEKMYDFAKVMKAQRKLPLRMVWTIPFTLLTAAMGEMSTVLTNSAKVSSEKIIKAGFQFKFKKMDEALKNLIG
ncbi:MAG: TIGR01777 family oxidoreductase [Bacteroidota bacterium]